MNFGDITLIYYSLFILTEIILHHGNRKQQILDLFQLPFSIVFTRFLNLFTYLIPDYGNSTFLIKLFVLFGAIVLTGIGAATMLNTNLIPNPGDGIVKAIADTIKKDIGFTKNCVDFICLCITVIIGLTLTHSIVGVGLGTVIAMIGVGRVIAVYQSIYKRIIK